MFPARHFHNPIVRSQSVGDPWVVRHAGSYYLTGTFSAQDGMHVWRSPRLSDLEAGEKVKVWSAPASGPMSKQLWAPELHRFDGRWYLYFTASDGIDANHRHYVLQSTGDDPLGPYAEPCRVDPELESYAIDGSVLRLADGSLYWMYAADGLWIVPMDSPLRVRRGATRVRFVVGTYDWESAWMFQDGRWSRQSSHWIEAPQALYRDGRTFLAYSAGHTATPHYCLGLLELIGRDPTDPAAWSRRPTPAFCPCPTAGVYTIGHNSFTTSPDGTEDWLVYHARDAEWDASHHRTVRAQPFRWLSDGTPDFAAPVNTRTPLALPSGEPA